MAKRTREDWLLELYDAQEKLSDFVEAISNGKRTYYKEAASKLRLLYCRKSSKPPLLKKISDEYQFDMRVYIHYTIQEEISRGLCEPSLGEGLVLNMVNSVTTWFERGSELVDIFQALDRDQIMIHDKFYTYREIFEVTADKMAIHIDDEVNDEYLEMHSEHILIGNLPIAQRVIYDTARASIIFINLIREYITENKKSHFVIARTGI